MKMVNFPVIDSSDVACLMKRPIVANVPVGAVDSTLGTVTQAYQMILPSIDDAGSSSIVISPFTSVCGSYIKCKIYDYRGS